MDDDAKKLEDRHDCIDSAAHIVGGESSDKGIEGGGCRANPEEKRDFNKDED